MTKHLRLQIRRNRPMSATGRAKIFQHVVNNLPDTTTRAHFLNDIKTTSATKALSFHCRHLPPPPHQCHNNSAKLTTPRHAHCRSPTSPPRGCRTPNNTMALSLLLTCRRPDNTATHLSISVCLSVCRPPYIEHKNRATKFPCISLVKSCSTVNHLKLLPN